MQKLCCVRTRQQFSASLVHFLSRSPPFLNQFSSIFGGNCTNPPPARPPANIPTFITPSAPPSIPPVWEHVIAVLMKLPPTTAEGQNMRAWVTYHSLTSLENFLMWELDTLQYDAITVCFPSRDTTQPHSLVSLKPNSIRHLIMLWKSITIWYRILISLCPQMPQIMP